MHGAFGRLLKHAVSMAQYGGMHSKPDCLVTSGDVGCCDKSGVRGLEVRV
jgi:hypothetical protein